MFKKNISIGPLRYCFSIHGQYENTQKFAEEIAKYWGYYNNYVVTPTIHASEDKSSLDSPRVIRSKGTDETNDLRIVNFSNDSFKKFKTFQIEALSPLASETLKKFHKYLELEVIYL